MNKIGEILGLLLISMAVTYLGFALIYGICWVCVTLVGAVIAAGTKGWVALGSALFLFSIGLAWAGK